MNTITIQHPMVLWGLLLLPLGVFWLLWSQRQGVRDSLAFSHIGLVRQLIQSPGLLWQQRLIPLLLLLSGGCLIMALSQPAWTTMVVTRHRMIMLAFDISLSMEAKDLKPNRLAAARQAALRFIHQLPPQTQVGLVFFAGNAFLITPPTADHAEVLDPLERLSPKDLREGTAIGDALLTSMDGLQAPSKESPSDKKPGSLSSTEYLPGAIVLMTDGENNMGTAPLVVTDQLVNTPIQVFTLGVGAEEGTFIRDGIYTQLDEMTLQTIAQQAHGQYYRVRSGQSFDAIYDQITHEVLGLAPQHVSLASWLVGLSGVFLVMAYGVMMVQRRY